MVESAVTDAVRTLHVVQETDIAAPIEIAFEAMLLELGPESQLPGGAPFPMTFEAWPGGRWFRDLGNNTGHFWGHVQVIKPPKLLEICGPLFMSYPATSHVQYRLTAEGVGTHIKITHRALGLITPEHLEGVTQGWDLALTTIKNIAHRLSAERSQNG